MGGAPGAPSSGELGRLCHWALQNTYYVRPFYQDWEMQQFYLTHRETAKMRRQRNKSQMKNRRNLQKRN